MGNFKMNYPDYRKSRLSRRKKEKHTTGVIIETGYIRPANSDIKNVLLDAAIINKTIHGGMTIIKRDEMTIISRLRESVI